MGPSTTQRYEVSFTYVEPEYARKRGIAEQPYIGSFEVLAHDPDEAVMLAKRAFWRSRDKIRRLVATRDHVNLVAPYVSTARRRCLSTPRLAS